MELIDSPRTLADGLEEVEREIVARLLATVRALQAAECAVAGGVDGHCEPNQAAADATDAHVNGVMAVMLSNDANFLKAKARAALQEPVDAD